MVGKLKKGTLIVYVMIKRLLTLGGQGIFMFVDHELSVCHPTVDSSLQVAKSGTFRGRF